jgi:hydroxymethylglutaryl-CoA reductase
MSVNIANGKTIKEAWQRCCACQEVSPYSLGSHQWLEEYLDFGDAHGANMKRDLYILLT